MEFGEDRSGQAEDGGRFGSTWTTSVRRLLSRIRRSSGLVDWIFFQCWWGKSAIFLRWSFGLQHLPEGVQLFVQVRADPGDLALRHPRVRAEGIDQVVDRPGGDAVDVGFHDHRVPAPAARRPRGRVQDHRPNVVTQAGGVGQTGTRPPCIPPVSNRPFTTGSCTVACQLSRKYSPADGALQRADPAHSTAEIPARPGTPRFCRANPADQRLRALSLLRANMRSRLANPQHLHCRRQAAAPAVHSVHPQLLTTAPTASRSGYSWRARPRAGPTFLPLSCLNSTGHCQCLDGGRQGSGVQCAVQRTCSAPGMHRQRPCQCRSPTPPEAYERLHLRMRCPLLLPR